MHCWNPWTYKCSNHALPKYTDNRNRKWQIVKARLYFELGHKLRQTAAINYGVRHSSQVAYNSSLAIFDLFHMLCVATMNSFSFVEENTWQVSQLILIARRPHGTIFTRKIKTFFITMKLKAKKLLEVVSVLSPFSLVPQPNPAPRVSNRCAEV